MSTEQDEDDGYGVEYPFFSAKVIEQTSDGWGRVTVGVFQQDSKDGEPKLLGSYKRNYSTNFNNFSFTRKGDRYFALYSPQYTATRVMEITPDVGFIDIGGEENHSDGFCPVDLYIPTVRQLVMEEFHCGPHEMIKDWSRLLDYFPPGSRVKFDKGGKGRQKLKYPDGKAIRAYNKPDKPHDYSWVWGPEAQYGSGLVTLPPKHAFVAGCMWGDDSSWKIEHIDVSRIDEGIIVRDDRYGYIELPEGMSLKNAIGIADFPENPRINIAVTLRFDVDTGEAFDFSGRLTQKLLAGAQRISAYEANRSGLSFEDNQAELKRRWVEQGERITKEVLETNGLIR